MIPLYISLVLIVLDDARIAQTQLAINIELIDAWKEQDTDVASNAILSLHQTYLEALRTDALANERMCAVFQTALERFLHDGHWCLNRERAPRDSWRQVATKQLDRLRTQIGEAWGSPALGTLRRGMFDFLVTLGDFDDAFEQLTDEDYTLHGNPIVDALRAWPSPLESDSFLALAKRTMNQAPKHSKRLIGPLRSRAEELAQSQDDRRFRHQERLYALAQAAHVHEIVANPSEILRPLPSTLQVALSEVVPEILSSYGGGSARQPRARRSVEDIKLTRLVHRGVQGSRELTLPSDASRGLSLLPGTYRLSFEDATRQKALYFIEIRLVDAEKQVHLPRELPDNMVYIRKGGRAFLIDRLPWSHREVAAIVKAWSEKTDEAKVQALTRKLIKDGCLREDSVVSWSQKLNEDPFFCGSAGARALWLEILDKILVQPAPPLEFPMSIEVEMARSLGALEPSTHRCINGDFQGESFEIRTVLRLEG